jgi:hypothetical protein
VHGCPLQDAPQGLGQLCSLAAVDLRQNNFWNLRAVEQELAGPSPLRLAPLGSMDSARFTCAQSLLISCVTSLASSSSL